MGQRRSRCLSRRHHRVTSAPIRSKVWAVLERKFEVEDLTVTRGSFLLRGAGRHIILAKIIKKHPGIR